MIYHLKIIISVNIISEFLSSNDLHQVLKGLDMALFSSLRDEGNGMLTEFVCLGGVACLNKFSFGYDFFKNKSPNKLITHEEFLNIEPRELKNMRMKKCKWEDDLATYKEISCMF